MARLQYEKIANRWIAINNCNNFQLKIPKINLSLPLLRVVCTDKGNNLDSYFEPHLQINTMASFSTFLASPILPNTFCTFCSRLIPKANIHLWRTVQQMHCSWGVGSCWARHAMSFQGCKNVNRLGVRVEITSHIISYNTMASFSTFLASPIFLQNCVYWRNIQCRHGVCVFRQLGSRG